MSAGTSSGTSPTPSPSVRAGTNPNSATGMSAGMRTAADVALVHALLVVAIICAAGLWSSPGQEVPSHPLLVGLCALATGSGIGALAARWRWGLLPILAAVCTMHLLIGPVLLFPRDRSGPSELWRWSEALRDTAALPARLVPMALREPAPLGVASGELAIVWLPVLAAAAVGMRWAVLPAARGGRWTAVLAPLSVLACMVEIAPASGTVAAALGGALAAAAVLWWPGLPADPGGSGLGAVRAASLLMIAAGMALVPLILLEQGLPQRSAVQGESEALRGTDPEGASGEHDGPALAPAGWASSSVASPLALTSGGLDARDENVLFTVVGAGPGSRIVVAVLRDHDGIALQPTFSEDDAESGRAARLRCTDQAGAPVDPYVVISADPSSEGLPATAPQCELRAPERASISRALAAGALCPEDAPAAGLLCADALHSDGGGAFARTAGPEAESHFGPVFAGAATTILSGAGDDAERSRRILRAAECGVALTEPPGASTSMPGHRISQLLPLLPAALDSSTAGARCTAALETGPISSERVTALAVVLLQSSGVPARAVIGVDVPAACASAPTQEEATVPCEIRAADLASWVEVSMLDRTGMVTWSAVSGPSSAVLAQKSLSPISTLPPAGSSPSPGEETILPAAACCAAALMLASAMRAVRRGHRRWAGSCRQQVIGAFEELRDDARRMGALTSARMRGHGGTRSRDAQAIDAWLEKQGAASPETASALAHAADHAAFAPVMLASAVRGAVQHDGAHRDPGHRGASPRRGDAEVTHDTVRAAWALSRRLRRAMAGRTAWHRRIIGAVLPCPRHGWRR